jgi:hypothetical protein
MIVIVDRGKGDAIVRYLREQNVMCNFILPGHGTASQQWLNLLGMGEIKKDVVISVLDKNRIGGIFEGLGEHFGIRGAGHGVAFTVAINSIGGKRLLNYCLGNVEE